MSKKLFFLIIFYTISIHGPLICVETNTFFPQPSFDEFAEKIHDTANDIVNDSMRSFAYYAGASACFLTSGGLLIHTLTRQNIGFNKKTVLLTGLSITTAALGTLMIIHPDIFRGRDQEMILT